MARSKVTTLLTAGAMLMAASVTAVAESQLDRRYITSQCEAWGRRYDPMFMAYWDGSFHSQGTSTANYAFRKCLAGYGLTLNWILDP